ncbi:hypothetical protein PISMIDRAFT_114744 [Pisolithus microcarpus 441]|uniref:Uncharacterized protein n=1 Tax=Pisolithus microcarpus 441 TaxID=765257 RepID=A0A0C9YPC8_9AGAM|nr:hypothetical protein PISMIDRAFT_114744 [Pisolithus microcarpus 441]
MDNATNNDTAMVVFAWILQEEHKFDIDPVAHHIHCFPHIINICIQHLINGYKCADFSGLPRTWGNPPRVLHKKEYITAVQEDPIWHGWETVQCICDSGQHWCNFQQTIESGNANQSFMKGGVPFPLPVVQLLHDVVTRWDSTYYMINCLRALDQVCDHHYSVLISKALLQVIDLWVRMPWNTNLVPEKLEQMHWEVLQDLEFALQVSIQVFGAHGQC